MQKTVVVSIERRKVHRVYKKVVRTTKKVMAHDETDAIGVGALVQIVESRPLSRHKRWVVEKVLEEAGARILQPVAGEVELHPEAPVEAVEEVVAENGAQDETTEDEVSAENGTGEEAVVDEVEGEEGSSDEEAGEEDDKS
jgi:small subunit ribosomal protein S17